MTAAQHADAGMVLTIRYDATGEVETFLLGRRFGKGANLPVYSTLSPLGHAIAGARPGEQRFLTMPNSTRPAVVTLLDAVPYRGAALPARKSWTMPARDTANKPPN